MKDLEGPYSTYRFVSLAVLLVVIAGFSSCGGGTAQLASADAASAAVRAAKPKPAKPLLAVADSSNNRVLIYNAPFKTDEKAIIVLGQPDFVHNAANQGAVGPQVNTLNFPGDVAQGPNGEIYVADTGNCRVLRFDPPLTTNMSASVVFGQPDFTSHHCNAPAAATANSLAAPEYLAVDSHGDLWVSDTFFGDIGDSRVVEYVPPFSNGMAASVAIGQTTTGASQGCNQVFGNPPHFAPPTASTLCTPKGISFDAAGDLWVADLANNRVVEFVPPFSTGMSASLEIGQPAGPDAFTTGTPNQCLYFLSPCGPTASKLFFPTATAFDSAGDLWVADAGNNRVLEYLPPFSNGMDASTVLGQPDFTSGGSGVITGYLASPADLAFQPGTGDLFVSDALDNRILMFAPPFRNDMHPATVIGQRNLNSGQTNQGKSAPAANTLDFPIGIAILH